MTRPSGQSALSVGGAVLRPGGADAGGPSGGGPTPGAPSGGGADAGGPSGGGADAGERHLLMTSDPVNAAQAPPLLTSDRGGGAITMTQNMIGHRFPFVFVL
ncbi:hypothetical protein NL108_006806 [Boleophthalmus pectinirostris]|nr:hypothetical protein NL108_006806 [Boleophthalmus pectinirostris]